MIPKIKELKVLKNYILQVAFDDGREVIYNVEEDISAIKSYEPLKSTKGLFSHVQLDVSRTVVFWNDEIDLPSDIIYEYGKIVK